jgi:hypothetical protein
VINRRAIHAILLELSRAQVTQNGQRATNAASHSSLADSAHNGPGDRDTLALGPAGQRVLDYVRTHGGREPEAILPDILGHRPHLRYGDHAFILCPEPGESVAAMRGDLEDAGKIVLVVAASDDLGDRLEHVRFWKL